MHAVVVRRRFVAVSAAVAMEKSLPPTSPVRRTATRIEHQGHVSQYVPYGNMLF